MGKLKLSLLSLVNADCSVSALSRSAANWSAWYSNHRVS